MLEIGEEFPTRSSLTHERAQLHEEGADGIHMVRSEEQPLDEVQSCIVISVGGDRRSDALSPCALAQCPKRVCGGESATVMRHGGYKVSALVLAGIFKKVIQSGFELFVYGIGLRTRDRGFFRSVFDHADAYGGVFQKEADIAISYSQPHQLRLQDSSGQGKFAGLDARADRRIISGSIVEGHGYSTAWESVDSTLYDEAV